MKRRVLFVDDEPNVLESLEDLMVRRRRKWDMIFAPGGAAALAWNWALGSDEERSAFGSTAATRSAATLSDCRTTHADDADTVCSNDA